MSEIHNSLTYIDNFITTEEELELVKFIDSNNWDSSLNRRTQQFGHKYNYKYSKTIKEEIPKIPEILLNLFKKIYNNGLCINDPILELEFNNNNFERLQIIINEYIPGQGISPHIDDPKQFGNWIVGISLISNIEMDFQYGNIKITKLIKRKSLYQMIDDIRYKYTHSIAKRKKDGNIQRNRRISITYRYKLQ